MFNIRLPRKDKVRSGWRPCCAAAWLVHPSTVERTRLLAQALARVKAESRPGDLAFLPGRRGTRLSGQRSVTPFDVALLDLGTPQQLARRALAHSEADAIVSSLETAPVHNVIESPQPTYAAPVFRCAGSSAATRSAVRDSPSPRVLALKLAEPARAGNAGLVQRDLGLAVWDPFPLLFRGGATGCAVYAHGKPLFFDEDHVSPIGDRALLNPFLANLQQTRTPLDQNNWWHH